MKTIRLLVLALTLLTVNIAFAADEIHWTVTGPNSVTFDWRGTAKEKMIGYGLTSGAYTTVNAKKPSPVPVSSKGPFWEAKLTGLKASTRYYYKIGTGPEKTFRTPPTPGSSNFNVYAVGNIGSTSTYFNTGAVQDIIAKDLPSFVVGLGDLTLGSKNGKAAVDQHFNDVMVWSKEAAYIPVWGDMDTVSSTKESFKNYKGRFAVPNPQTSPGSPLAGGEDWYWFDYGNVRFITLPEPWTGALTNWKNKAGALMAEAQADSNIKFIVTFVHRPAYSSGHYTGSSTLKGILDKLGDTYSKYKLNISAHSNNYERSLPQHGVTHITAGTGGANLTQDGACLWKTCAKPAWSAFRAMHLGVLKLHFTDSRIEGSFICGPAGGGKNDVTCTTGSAVDSFLTNSLSAESIVSPSLQIPDASDSLIARWDFNEATGNSVTDRVSMGNYGILTDGPVRGKEGNRSFIVFDGLNDRVQNIPAGPLAYSGGGNRTFALWIWPDRRDTDGGYIFSKPWNGNGAYNYNLRQLADGRLQWQVQGASLTAPAALAPDLWHQVVVGITSAGFMSIYLDGQPVSSAQRTLVSNAATLDKNISLCLGSIYPYGSGWIGNSTYSWQGKLDDMRVYSRTLSVDEIRQLYDRGKPAPGFPMVTLLAPASTDTITSQIHLLAEAQDLAGIAGVKFQADGQALVAEDLTAPYELTLPKKLANGIHSFTAAARNGLGNTTTSSPVLVTSVGNNGVIAQPVEPISPIPILPNTWPVPGIVGNEINITAAADQYEAASFVLRSEFRDYNGIKVEVSDLSGPGGLLSKEQVDIRLVKAWYQASTAWTGDYTGGIFPVGDYSQKLVPELLLKDESLVQVDRVAQKNYLRVNRGAGNELVWVNIPNQMNAVCFKVSNFPFQDSSTLQPFSLPRQFTQQVWLTVHAPGQIKSGTYTGNIIIRVGKNELTRLILRVKVPAFALADFAAGIYYTSVLDPANATLGSHVKTEIQMRAEMRNMWEHGVKDFTLYQPLSQMESVLKLRQDMGMIRSALYTYVSASSLNTTIQKLVNLAHAYGFTDTFFYGNDEASGSALTEQRTSWQRVHELGGKIFVAGYTDAFDLVGDLLDVQVHASRPLPEYATKWHEVGHSIFSYANPQSGKENPYSYRRNYGLVLWAAGYDKAYTWAYQAAYGNQWNDLDADKPPKVGRTYLYRDENFTYSTANGVIDTIAWEGYREAIDDVRYIKTLEQTINQAQTSASPLVQQVAADAQSYLDGLRSTVLQLSGMGEITADFNLNLKQKREEVVQHIEAILTNQAKR